jgi:hypothetical protein
VQRVRVLVGGMLVAAGMLGAAAPAMAQVAAIPVEIRVGTCDDLGDVVTSVTDIPRTAGAFIGSPDTLIAEGDFASVPLALQGLTDVPHALVALDDVGGNVIACGGVGGVVNGEGALIFGLAEEQGSGVNGIAYFAPIAEGAQTEISVFVAGEFLPGDRQFAGGQRTTQSAQQVQAAQDVVTQGLSADEQAYIDDVLPIIDTMSASLETAGDLFENPRFGEDDWNLSVAVELATWRVAYDDALAIQPPPAFVTMHELFLESMRLFSDASFDIANGLDAFDAGLLESGANKMIQGSDYLIQASDELDRISEERGG